MEGPGFAVEFRVLQSTFDLSILTAQSNLFTEDICTDYQLFFNTNLLQQTVLKPQNVKYRMAMIAVGSGTINELTIAKTEIMQRIGSKCGVHLSAKAFELEWGTMDDVDMTMAMIRKDNRKNAEEHILVLAATDNNLRCRITHNYSYYSTRRFHPQTRRRLTCNHRGFS